MLRTMLLDDEPMALEGLRLLIDWQAEGFTICCECKSAQEALDMLPAANPDLIVTDIRMPGMTGLELVQAARQAGFTGQFIIVSGYSDFNYAKAALQLGVAGYLIKPVEPADASAVLAHVRLKLIDKEAEEQQRQKAVYQAISTLLAQPGASADGLPDTGEWIVATWGAPLPYQTVQDILALYPAGTATAHIVEDKEYLVLRPAADGQTPGTQAAEALLLQHRRTLTTASPANGPLGLHQLRRQLSDTLNNACHVELTGHVDRIVRAVALRQADECVALCQALEDVCAACGARSLMQVRRQVLSACVGLLSDRGEATQTFLQSQDAGLQTLCLLAIKLLAPETQTVSDRMERYALEHSGSHITVGSIATALKYNSTYLGRKYLEERGVSFRQWLMGQRMQKAAQLLRTTDQSVNSIAKAVGYAHYKRFLQHFKKRFGIAPDAYRKQRE